VGEGLFLRPQHFQRQDAYHEARLFESIQAIQPYNWGLRSVRIDRDALGSNVLRVAELALVFPDGALYAAPQADDLPPPIALDTLPDGINEFVFYLALHPLRENSTNYSDDPASGFTTRFVSEQTSVADNFTDAAEADITFLKTQVKLIAHSEPRDQLLSVPLVRVRRTATSGFELDDSFVPPCLAIEASPILHQRLRQLVDALQAKVNALYGFHREPSKNIIEFRSGDIASFWLLHTANAAFATLAHLHQHAALHPERLFQELLRLAGQLMTFSKGYTLADLPVYRHDDPGPSFARLDLMLRELLDTVISTRYFAITLDECVRRSTSAASIRARSTTRPSSIWPCPPTCRTSNSSTRCRPASRSVRRTTSTSSCCRRCPACGCRTCRRCRPRFRCGPVRVTSSSTRAARCTSACCRPSRR
jgi:type VI secretion system protein ImpJ